MADYAAGEAGLEPWMLLTSVNGTPIESAADFGEALNRTWAGQNVTVQALDKGQPRSFDVTLDDKGSYYLQYYPDYYEQWMSGKGFLGVAVTDQSVVTEGLVHPAQDGWSMLLYITLPFQDLQPFPEHFTALFAPAGLPGSSWVSAPIWRVSWRACQPTSSGRRNSPRARRPTDHRMALR